MYRGTFVQNVGCFLSLFALLLLPCQAEAAVEWATWGAPVGNYSIGTLSGGRTVTLVADFTGTSGGTAAGATYTTSPSVVGRPDNTNPPYTGMMTGSATLNPGDNVALVDLSDLPVGASVIFGIGDQKYSMRYQLELRDAAFAIIPLDNIVVTPYNVTYNTDPLFGGTNMVADYNSVLIGNVLWVDTTHDDGGLYTHTGLTTLSSLPPETCYILLKFPGTGVQDPEGIQIYVGAELSSTLTVTDDVGDSTHALAFGNVTIGGQDLKTVTVTNGTAAPVAVSFSDGLASPFAIADPGDCTRTLSPAESCTISVTFTPTDETPRNDSFTFDLGGTPWAVSVSGTGVLPSVRITGSSLFDNTTKVLDFAATVLPASTGSETVTFTNTSGINLPVHLVEGLSGPFSFLDNAACDRTLGILGAGTSCTMTVVFAPDANGVFTDTFKVNAGGVDHTITVRGNPGLANADFGITQTVTPGVVSPNGTDTTTFTLTVRNNGPDAAAAVVTDVLPAGLTVDDAAPATVGVDNRTVTWDVGILASGSETTLEITARAGTTASGCLTNTATVTVDNTDLAVDSNGANNSASVYIGAPACADLSMAATAVSENIGFTYELNNIHVRHFIRVTNNGPGPATGATLDVTDYDGTGQYDNNTTTLTPVPRTFSIGNIAVGETVEVLIAEFEVGRASGDHTARVAATVEGSEPDPNPANNSSSGTYLIDGENQARNSPIFGCLSTTGRKSDNSLTNIFGAYGPLILMAIGLKAYSIVRYRKPRRRV